MRWRSVLLFTALILWATAASAEEEIARLLTARSERFLELLDQKNFLAIRAMQDPELRERIPEDIFLKTMNGVYGALTIFYDKPKLERLGNAGAEVSVRIIYFREVDIGVDCQEIYWVLRGGEWFLSHFMTRAPSGSACAF